MGTSQKNFFLLRLFVLVLFQLYLTSCAVRLQETTLKSSISISYTLGSSAQVLFNGWKHVQALGGRSPVATASPLATTTASVTLEWEQVSFTNNYTATIQSYNIYRSTTSHGQNLNVPLVTGVSSETRSYTDTTVNANTTYYYLIAPVVNEQAYIPLYTADQELKVIVPPVNMSLVHRWMANREICTLLGEETDRDNDYRCAYSGPGKSTGDFYDLESSYFVDTVEAGCNYTRGTSCGGADCIGTAAPGAGLGSDGDIYYIRGGTGYCYVKRAGAWVVSDSATDAELGTMYSNSPGLPPFGMVDQAEAGAACSQYSVNGRTKTLMSRKLQFVASAYDEALTDAEIVTLEDASGAYASNGCNSDSGHGAYPSDNLDIPANEESLPYSTAATWSAYRTGSTSTEACISRFGIQDLTGNVWEGLSDQITTGSGVTSSVDPGNSDLNGVDFDNNEAVGAAGNFSTHPEINLALGIPMSAAAPSGWSTVVGSGIGEFDSAQFHGDIFGINVAAGTRRAMAGGAYGDNANAGRFALGMSNLTTVRQRYFGFRCSVEAE